MFNKMGLKFRFYTNFHNYYYS